MTKRELTKKDAKNAVYGGCILGGGGGGWIDDGLEKLEEIFKIGNPILLSADDLHDEDYVVSVALVGAPSAKNIYVNTEQMVGTITRIQKEFNEPIRAIMTNENGASTTINGWLQAAATGLPFLDAPCNGRAHPTGSMGSLNLSEEKEYKSIQAYAGGKREREVEGFISSSLDKSSNVVRSVSIEAGGMISVCRNPINIKYVKDNAALGGISQAIKLGSIFLSEEEGLSRIEAVCSFLNGNIITSGLVRNFNLEQTGGFDVGIVTINDFELTIWNEYMTAEKNGKRIGTFPDLIMTFDAKTGMPIVSAEIEKDQEITVILVPKSELLLSTTMSNQKLLQAIEPIINKDIIRKEDK